MFKILACAESIAIENSEITDILKIHVVDLGLNLDLTGNMNFNYISLYYSRL